jgi:hypothetical protein
MTITVVCTKCGTVGQPKMVAPGYAIITLILWCFFILPGLFYSIYRSLSRYPTCNVCKSRDVVGIDTPIGKSLVKKIYSEA